MPHDQERHGRLYRASERVFDWVLGKYEATLEVGLAPSSADAVVTLLTMAATVYLYVIIPKGFFPQQDTGRINGSIHRRSSDLVSVDARPYHRNSPTR